MRSRTSSLRNGETSKVIENLDIEAPKMEKEQIEEYQDIQAEFKRLQVKVDAKTATEADLLNIVRESGEIQQR